MILKWVDNTLCFLQRDLTSSLEGLCFFVHGPEVEFRWVSITLISLCALPYPTLKRINLDLVSPQQHHKHTCSRYFWHECPENVRWLSCYSPHSVCMVSSILLVSSCMHLWLRRYTGGGSHSVVLIFPCLTLLQLTLAPWVMSVSTSSWLPFITAAIRGVKPACKRMKIAS